MDKDYIIFIKTENNVINMYNFIICRDDLLENTKI
jgi:hypothetical protein